MHLLAPDSSAHFDGDSSPTHASFTRRPFVQNVLPWLASLALHLGLVIFGIATYKVVTTFAPVTREPPIIPDMGEMATLDKLKSGTITRQSVDAATLTDLPAVQEVDASRSQPRGVLDGVLNPGRGDPSDSVADTLIGVSPKGGGFFGPRNGDGVGNAFGLPDGNPTFMKLPVASSNPTGNAKRIVFVCDASGSMIATFDTLRVQIRKATDALNPRYSYNVIFFSGGPTAKPRSLDGELRPATPAQKRRTAEFLDTTQPVGETFPLPALQLAFQQKPDLIFLLTDGDFPDNQAVVDTIHQLNPTRRVKVNTILFVANKAAAEENAAFAKVLQRIADDNGGQSKVADASQMD